MLPARTVRRLARVVAPSLGAAAVLLPAVPAHGGSYTQTDEQFSWYGRGATQGHARAYVRAYTKDYGCGLKDCAVVHDMYGSVNGFKDGDDAALPSAVKMHLRAGFGGTELSVGIGASAGGPSAGVSFHDLGSACGTDDVQNSGASISIDAPGEVCKASTWGWVSNIDVMTSGLYRLGTGWHTVDAFDRVSVGGF